MRGRIISSPTDKIHSSFIIHHLSFIKTCRGDHNVFEANLRIAKCTSAQNAMIPL